MLMVAGMNGVVVSGDLFNLYVFLEIASIASYALVAFGVEADELEAGFKYLILGSVASVMILVRDRHGLRGHRLAQHGGRGARDGDELRSGTSMNPALLLAAALFLMGFGLKAALVPFHAWLPDAHPSAPAPDLGDALGRRHQEPRRLRHVPRLLPRVRVRRPELSRVPSIIANSMIAFAVLSIVLGGLLAIGQWDFKRLLAYSSIGQIGYVMLGLGVGAQRSRDRRDQRSLAGLAILGGLFHLINHAAFKSLLFLSSGAIQHATGHARHEAAGGPEAAHADHGGDDQPRGAVDRRRAAVQRLLEQAHHHRRDDQGGALRVIAAVAIAMAFVTLAYYVKVQREMLFGSVRGCVEKASEVPALMYVPLIILAIVCVGFGLLLPGRRGDRILEPARDALLNGAEYIKLVLG